MIDHDQEQRSALDNAQEGQGEFELELDEYFTGTDVNDTDIFDDQILEDVIDEEIENQLDDDGDQVATQNIHEKNEKSKTAIKAESNDKADVAQEDKPIKKGLTKNKILGIVLVGLAGTIGYPIIDAYLSSQAETTVNSGAMNFVDKVEESKVGQQHAPQQSVLADAKQAKIEQEMQDLKARYDAAFIALNDVLKEKDEKISILNEKLTALTNNANLGGEKLVEQNKRFENIEQSISSAVSRLAKIESGVAKRAKKEKEEKELKVAQALRAKFEVITVITGKIRLRNANTGNEQNYIVGDVIDGFGKISAIDISGCITLANNEKFEPIGATCNV